MDTLYISEKKESIGMMHVTKRDGGKVLIAVLGVSAVVLVALYTSGRSTVFFSYGKEPRYIIVETTHAMWNVTMDKKWLLEAVDKLSFRTMTPSSFLLEDLYFTPNYQMNVAYNEELLIQPDGGCDDPAYLLIMVPSAPRSFRMRKAIRETWGTAARGKSWPWRIFNTRIKLVFVIGVEFENSTPPTTDGDSKPKKSEVLAANHSKMPQSSESNFLENKTLEDISTWSSDHVAGKKYVRREADKNEYHISRVNLKTLLPLGKTSHADAELTMNSRLIPNSIHQTLKNSPLEKSQNETKSYQFYTNDGVTSESYFYNDILLFNMGDSYRNLTRKMILALRWATNSCRSVKYILKADQDVFVNVPLLVTFLKHYGESNSIYGHIYTNSWVVRSGKWGVSKLALPIPRYPIYAAGNAYVLSKDAATKIVKMCQHFPYIPVEDAFITGILASVCDINRVNVLGFTKWSERQPDACDFVNDKRYMGNNNTEHHIKIIWRDLIDKGYGRCGW